MNWIRAAFYCVLAACAIVLTFDVHRQIVSLGPKAAAALTSVQAIETNTTRTEAEMSGLLNAQRHSVVNEKRVLDAATSAFGHLGSAAVSLNELIVSAKEPIRSANGLIVSADGAIVSVKDNAHATMKKSQEALGAAHDALAAAAEQLGNPDIAQSLADIRASAASTANGTADLAATAADVHKIADHETALILKPVGKLKRALQIASSAVGSFIHSVLF